MPKKSQDTMEIPTPETGKPRAVEFIPFTGADDLPDYKVISAGEPKKGRPPRFELAPPRFACARGERNTVKVLAFYRHPHGTLRKLWATLKLTKKRPRDIATYEKLKAARIPGAF